MIRIVFFYFEKLNYGLSYFPELPHPTLGARGEATSVINLKKIYVFLSVCSEGSHYPLEKHCDIIIPYIRVSCRFITISGEKISSLKELKCKVKGRNIPLYKMYLYVKRTFV